MGRLLDIAKAARISTAPVAAGQQPTPTKSAAEITPLVPRHLTTTNRFTDFTSCADQSIEVELALKVGAHLEGLPENHSATAEEITRAIFGRDGTLDRVMDIFQLAESLVSSRVLIRGCDGFGYQLSAPFSGVK